MIARTRRDALRFSALMQRRQAFTERWAQPRLKRALNKIGQLMADAYEMAGEDRFKAEEDQYREVMASELAEVYDRSAMNVRNMAKDASKAFWADHETKQELDDEDLGRIYDLILQDLAEEALTQATTIVATMKADVVAAILADDELLREGPAQVARVIRSRVSDMSSWKSLQIARTETVAAISAAQDKFTAEIWDEVEDGPLYKQWFAGSDSRTRDDHRDVDEKIVRYDKTFKVGGDDLRYPGDRRGKPKNVVNCRCSWASIPESLVPVSER